MPPHQADAIVIGSGISGLTTAALLAKSGRQVVLIEKNKKPGGALRRFKRAGIPFDIGFHYTGGLGNKEILRVLWEYLGVWPNITAVPLHPGGHDLFRFRKSGRSVRAYYSYDLLQEELITNFPREAGGIRDFLANIRRICRTVPFYNLDLPLTPFLRDYLTAGNRSLADVIQTSVKDPELQAILAAPALLYGIPPRNAGFALHSAVTHGYYSGAYGIVGGGQAIVDAFITVLQRTGTEIITNCPVEHITVKDGTVQSVIAGGHEIKAEQVIYTGQPNALPDLTAKGTFRPAYIHRLKDLEDTKSMFILFGKLDCPDDGPRLATTNLYSLPPGVDIMDAPSPGTAGETLLVTAPGRRDVSDGSDAPAANGVIVMRPASWEEAATYDLGHKKRRTGYQTWKEETATTLLTEVEKCFGDLCPKITPLATGTPLTFRDELGGPQGGVYGTQHNMTQFAPRARTKVEGLTLSGQSTLMTGLLGSSLAGLVTAGEIIGLETIWDQVLT
ncbi:MAG: NAD(P)/FAD-dependent oxidoreductase [Proteobacteria bacterium]|nr:NAD(P)/FAD-dependent oxidoreductase [Pseudomonadota bacterium]MBU1688796.1 NAD(P)/FAD-dependent oxidoreductase [Pseudomonadota bacterium]